MGISLAEVLDILELDIGAVKAGRNAMDNLVVRVNVLEAPDAIKWLAGNELLLTTGYALQGDTNFHRDFLQQLAAKGIAGLGIKAGRYLDPIPPEMIQEGNRLGFPIIELPAYLPLSQVITPVYEVLLNQQVSRLKRSQEIHAKFLEIVFRGNGFESICSTLTSLIDKPVLIVDARHQVLAHSGEDFLSPLEVADLKKDLEGIDLTYDEITAPKTYETYEFIPIEARIQNETRQVAFFPIIGGNHVWGAIFVLDVAKDIDFQSITACEHAATIAALEFAKQDSIFRANLTSESQLLEDIIEGNFSSLQSVQRRLGYFGFKLQGNLRAMVLDIIDFESYYLQEAKKGEKHFQKVKDEIYRETKAMFHGFPGSFLGGMKSDSVIAIASLKDEEAENRFRLIVRKLSSALQKKFPQIDISFGIGRPCSDLTGVHQSFEEAVIACKVGRNLGNDNLVAYYENLGAFICLAEMKNWPIAHQFCAETIGVLEKYDTDHGTELVHTLDSYFLCNDNVRQTAKKLFIHRNSLEYRLKRIEELTGRKLSCFYDRFEMMLALLLGKLLKIADDQ